MARLFREKVFCRVAVIGLTGLFFMGLMTHWRSDPPPERNIRDSEMNEVPDRRKAPIMIKMSDMVKMPAAIIKKSDMRKKSDESKQQRSRMNKMSDKKGLSQLRKMSDISKSGNEIITSPWIKTSDKRKTLRSAINSDSSSNGHKQEQANFELGLWEKINSFLGKLVIKLGHPNRL